MIEPWQASYPTKAPLQTLSTLLRTEPAGNWTLTIDNDGAALALLEDFTLETIGAMVQLPPGSDSVRPAALRLASGAQGAVATGTTLSRRNSATSSCAATPAGDAWYEFTVPAANTATVTVTAAFDATVELFRGSCTARTSIACNDNTVGRNPRITNAAIAAGAHCISVDGRASSSGNFQLSLCLGAAVQ
jgi:hypothetical protein